MSRRASWPCRQRQAEGHQVAHGPQQPRPVARRPLPADQVVFVFLFSREIRPCRLRVGHPLEHAPAAFASSPKPAPASGSPAAGNAHCNPTTAACRSSVSLQVPPALHRHRCPHSGLQEASRPASPEEMDGGTGAAPVTGPSRLPAGAALPDRTPLDSPSPEPAFLTVPSSSAGLRRVRTPTDRLLPAADGPDDYDPFEYFTPPPVPKFGFWRVEGDVSVPGLRACCGRC